MSDVELSEDDVTPRYVAFLAPCTLQVLGRHVVVVVVSILCLTLCLYALLELVRRWLWTQQLHVEHVIWHPMDELGGEEWIGWSRRWRVRQQRCPHLEFATSLSEGRLSDKIMVGGCYGQWSSSNQRVEAEELVEMMAAAAASDRLLTHWTH